MLPSLRHTVSLLAENGVGAAVVLPESLVEPVMVFPVMTALVSSSPLVGHRRPPWLSLRYGRRDIVVEIWSLRHGGLNQADGTHANKKFDIVQITTFQRRRAPA